MCPSTTTTSNRHGDIRVLLREVPAGSAAAAAADAATVATSGDPFGDDAPPPPPATAGAADAEAGGAAAPPAGGAAPPGKVWLRAEARLGRRVCLAYGCHVCCAPRRVAMACAAHTDDGSVLSEQRRGHCHTYAARRDDVL